MSNVASLRIRLLTSISYMGCAQLKITGTGSAGSCTPEIQIPGTYKPEDPNIYIPNVYNGW